jgi:hypothetical protein
MLSNLRLDTFDIGEPPCIIEEDSFEPIINSTSEIKRNTMKDIDLNITITLLRLFKKGFVTYSYIFPIKGNDFPFDICKPKSDNPYIEQDEDLYFLNDVEAIDFVQFWKRFKKTLLKIRSEKKKWSNINLSLDRFNSSYYRPNNADRFIDLCIAVEALFSRKEDIFGTLGHKYSLRLSRMLGAKLGNYKKFYTNMLDLYGVRSKIVHGSTPGKLKHKTNLLEDYVRESLKNYLIRVEQNKVHDKIMDEVDFN